MKIALVTGAASGIGEAIARRLHAGGLHVVVADIDEAGGWNVVASLGSAADFMRLDVTREADWVEVIEQIRLQLGGLHVLVNNAGITTVGDIESLSLQALQRELDINLSGPFLGCKHGIGLMKESGGSIVNIASGCSRKIRADLVGYNASKAAVTAMSKAVALHCAQQAYGIRVNTVHPGAIHTPILDKVLRQSGSPDALLASFIADHPIGRIGQPEDIAAMVAFLVSEQASFATGAEFFVDGGMTL